MSRVDSVDTFFRCLVVASDVAILGPLRKNILRGTWLFSGFYTSSKALESMTMMTCQMTHSKATGNSLGTELEPFLRVSPGNGHVTPG